MKLKSNAFPKEFRKLWKIRLAVLTSIDVARVQTE